MTRPVMNNNGMPLHVPDLAQRAGPDPAGWAQQVLMQAAGLTPGAGGIVDTMDGHELELRTIDVALIAGPGGLQILSVAGEDAANGQQTMIPWHAVVRIRPAAPTLATG
jgi:hypothetical protein